jgi:hypothetical protein
MQLILRYLTAPFRFLLKGPTYLIAAPRKIWGMSPPARAAALLEVVLVFCTVIVAVKFLWGQNIADVGRRLEIIWSLAVIAILVAAPLATYYLVKLWLSGEASRYPDIDRAWTAGLEALAEHGLDLTSLPIYVILGLPNEVETAALMAAARVNAVVAGVPKGPVPLRWYASDNAIFLIYNGLGRLSRLSELAASRAGAGRPGGAATNPIAATMVAGAPRPSSPAEFPSESTQSSGRAQILGTLVAGAPTSGDDGGRSAAPPSSSGMSRKDSDEQTERLAYTLGRLSRARQPYCANNGVLTVIPHNVLSDVTYAREAPDAVRSDLAVLRQAGRVTSAVTLLVTGMEAEGGFAELVRRVGVDRSRSSRFGKGFDVWNVASDENLDALSLHACGSFEDWVYTLFADDNASEPRSNGKLFSMLCHVRRHLQPRLRGVLVNGFAVESEGNGEPARLFSGCYFAATGRQGEQQAFVHSVFDKLDQLSEDLQWSDEALREETIYRWMFWLLSTANAAMLVAIVVLALRLLP